MKKSNKKVLLRFNERKFCPEELSSQCIDFKFHTIEANSSYYVTQSNCNQLFFFLEGNATIQHGRFQEFSIRKNELFLLPKMEDMKCIANTKLQFIVHFFNAPANVEDFMALQSLVANYRNVEYKIKPLDIYSPLNDFLALLQIYLNNGIDGRYMLEVKQKELFMLFHNFYTKQENATLFAPIVDQSVDFVATVMKYLKKAKSVSELASYCNCSRASFNRAFKKHFNVTPYKWVQRQTLNLILSKLVDENIPFSSIVDEFNFSSAAHFTTFCKKHLGMTPSQYRKKQIMLRGEGQI